MITTRNRKRLMSTLQIKPVTLYDPALYLNRGLSLLEFQRRVLAETQDKEIPLLERVKFLAIFVSNMDDFCMLKLSSLSRQEEKATVTDGSVVDEMTAIHSLASELYTAAFQCLQKKLLPKLKKSGIHLVDYSKLNKHQREQVHDYFKKVIFPLLIPLPLDQSHPFPHISNLYLNLAVVLRTRKGHVRLMRLQ